MKSLWFLIVAFLVTIAACQEQGEQAGTIEETPAVDAATVEQSIRDASDRYEQAALAGDVPTLVSFYTDDAILLPPGMLRSEGTTGITAAYTEMYAGGNPTTASLDPQTIVVSESGDMAYEAGTFSFTGIGPDGTEMTDSGKYVAIWKPTETGEWKIAVDIWNSDAMPGAVPGTTETETAPTTEGQ